MNEKGVQRRRFGILVAALLSLGAVIMLGYYFGYLPRTAANDTQTQKSMMLMDTLVDVRVDGRGSEELVPKVFEEMASLEQTLSRFVATSEVAKINEQSGEWVRVSPQTLELVQLGVEMGHLSDGAFDITVGPLLDLWGFGTGDYAVPSEEELVLALEKIDYTQVEVDSKNSSVRIPQGFIMDLGGIAKGFIVDQGIQILRNAKVQRSIINAGGDIGVVGTRPDNQPWRVGVQDPSDPSEIRWILPLNNNSVVTSGDYQRFFTKDGQRYHHILNPKTGYPAQGLRSVTVVGPDTATSDALSTAIFVLGWDQGKALVTSLPDVEAVLVSDAEVWISPGLSQLVTTQ